MLVTRTSIATNIKRTQEIPCTPEQLEAFENGMDVDKAFPKLNLFHREFIMSGITRQEWIEAFGEKDNGFGKEPQATKAASY